MSLRQRVERLHDAIEARRRVQMHAAILDLPTCPAWATPLPDGRCVRIVGGNQQERRRAVQAIGKGASMPGLVTLDYRPGAAEAIRLAVDPATPPEVAIFGARGDGKSWSQLEAVVLHADLHRERGGAVPVRGLAVTDYLAGHRLRMLRTATRAEWAGIWQPRDDGRLLVLVIDGVELVHLDLVGVEDQGALDRLRLETCILLGDELAPAGVMEMSAGVSLDAWMIARTSQRLPSYKRPAIAALNYPDLDHWVWDRWVVKQRTGTAYVRITPGERASPEQRLEWAAALDGRPDLMRRLLEGEPGVIAEGPQVAVGYRSDVHVSRTRLTVMENVPLLIGIDGGLTPAAVLAQYVGDGAGLNVLASLACERGGTRQLCEDYIRPWLASRAPWALHQRRAIRCYVDPSLETADQSNLEASPTRVITDVLGCGTQLGPSHWPPRRDPLLTLLGKVNPYTGRPAVQLDPEDAVLLDRALSGRWHYRVVRGQVSREEPVKNHPWSDLADCLTYIVAGVAPTQATRDPNRPRQMRAYTTDNPRPDWSTGYRGR